MPANGAGAAAGEIMRLRCLTKPSFGRTLAALRVTGQELVERPTVAANAA